MPNEFEDDIVFARYINYMKKALLHRKINYIKHKRYLENQEKIVPKNEWIVLKDNTVHSFFDFDEDKEVKIQQLKQAINTLTEKQKEVIVLYYYKKKPLKFIAEITNSNVNTVKQIKLRAINRLKKYMEEKQNEDKN